MASSLLVNIGASPSASEFLLLLTSPHHAAVLSFLTPGCSTLGTCVCGFVTHL